MAKIHDKLRRLLANSSVSAISKAAGMGPSTLLWLLDNEREISAGTIEKLAKIIGVPISFLTDDQKNFPVLVNPPKDELRRRSPSAA